MARPATVEPDFRALFEASPGAFLVLLPDAPTFTIVAASDAYLAATLVSRAAAVGRGMFEVFPDPAPHQNRPAGADLRTSFETVLRTGAEHRMGEHRYDLRRPDGVRAVRWWSALNTPVHDADGQVQYILHQAEDVTERASRTRFQQLAAVLERLSVASAQEDALEVVRDGARGLVGAAGASLVLREGEQCHYVTADSLAGPLWMGQRFPLGNCISGWTMLHGRTAVVEDVLNDERVPSDVYEPTFVRSLIMVPVGTPEPFAAIGAYWAEPQQHDPEDVAALETLARVAAEVIGRSRAEARYRTLFDSIDAGFCVIEVLFDEQDRAVDYRFLEVNEAFERHTGLRDPVGRRMRELAPAHEEHWFALYGRVARTGERIRFENAAAALDRFYDVDAFRVGSPEQRRVAVLFNDISERRRSEERLREASRLEAVGELAGGVAHEANNQMSVILGLADFVLRRGDVAAPVRDDVEQMRRAAERTALVTAQLLAFGRRQLLRPAVLDLNRVITDLAPVLGRTLGVDSRLVLALAPDLGPVRADSRQLDQVLLNLTLNARDAMPGGGTLTIRTSNERVGSDGSFGPREVVAPGDYVRLVVSDTGEGIEESIRHRIFDPFFTTKPVGQGTGLGLASVYGIVKQSGGSIAAKSAAEGGAQFVIHLPRAEPGPAAAATAPESIPAAAGETVLVVEDEPAVRAMLSRTLAEAGYRVLEAGDGRGALDLLDAEPGQIDLVLTDVVMPRMSGPTLAAELRARCPGIPVIFISGYASEERAPPLGGSGAPAAFLRKPISPEDLLRAVRECCTA
jgi:PAS domain S-box-containing protein